MGIQTRNFLGYKFTYEDGLFDHTQAKEFHTAVHETLNNINSEIAMEHKRKYLENLKIVVDQNVKHWSEQFNKTKSDLQQHIDEFEKQLSEIGKKDRNLTADEVSVLTYHANMLKSKIALSGSDGEFKEFMNELLKAPEQVRHAFLDNAPGILKEFKNDMVASEIRKHMNIVKSSLLTENELQLQDEINSKIKGYNQQRNATVVKEMAITKIANELKGKIDWEVATAVNENGE